MRPSGTPTAMIDEVARFQAEVRRLAFAAVRMIIQHELDRRPAKPETARPRKRQPARPAKREPTRQLELGFAPAKDHQLALPLARQTEIQPEPASAGSTDPPDAAVVPVAVTPEPPPEAPTGRRKRVPWTRESIVSELTTWMLSGTAIDAQFLTRHGPPGLVAAIRRIFGRFEAALNVAALNVSKLYPDGPPSRQVLSADSKQV
jgi:hypothetical protein